MQFAILIFSFLFAFVSCTKDETTTTTLSDLAALQLSYQGTDIAANGANFIISLPSGSVTTSVNFTLKVSPKAKLYEGSSTTALTLTSDSINISNKDLTNAVSYKVVSESGKTTLTYTLKAELRQATSKEIQGFTFTKSKNPSLAEDISGTIDGNTISVSLPYGTAKTSLIPSINHNGKSINPADGIAQDFSSDKTYTVTAEDNNTKAYIVKVTVLPQTIYTVSFETNGGSAVNAQTIGSGASATKPTDPTLAGNQFAGWYKESTFATPFDFATPITASTTLYAKWLKVYTFTFAQGTVWSTIVGYDITIKADGNVVKTEPNYTSNTYTFVASSSITNTSQLEVSVQAKKTGNIVVGNDTIRFAGSATNAQTLTLKTVGARVKFVFDYSQLYQNKISIDGADQWPGYVLIVQRRIGSSYSGYASISGEGFVKYSASYVPPLFAIVSPYTLTIEYIETNGNIANNEILFQWTRLDSGDAANSASIPLNLKEGEINDLGTIIMQ